MKRQKKGGRKKGTLNKTTQEIKEISRRLLSRPKYLRELEKAVDSRSLHPSVESMLYYYAYGKPKEIIENVNPVAVKIVHQLSGQAAEAAEGTADAETPESKTVQQYH